MAARRGYHRAMSLIARNALRSIVLAMALAAWPAGPAYPQASPDEAKRYDAQQKERESKAREKAYKSAVDVIPAQQRPVDPWGNVRPNAATPPPAKAGR